MRPSPSSPASTPAEPNVVIIDNYDSFTFNIRESLAKLGVDAKVIRNDELTPEEFAALDPSHIIIGPGPGTPDCPEDVGISFAAIDFAIKNNRALLGICLGHQAIGKHFGAKIIHAPVINHGKTSTLELRRDAMPKNHHDLYRGVTDAPEVMRYHSLAVSDLPKTLIETSRVYDLSTTTTMSFQHRELPIFGVQFHPESFATPDGLTILENFLQTNPLAYEVLKKRGIPEHEPAPIFAALPPEVHDCLNRLERRPFSVREFPCALPPEELYARLHAASSHMYALESLETHAGDATGRYSYFGFQPAFVISACNEKLFLDDQEVNAGTASPMEILKAMQAALTVPRGESAVPEDQRLTGGLVGYAAYEAAQYREPQALKHLRTPPDQKTFAFGYFPDGLTYDRATKKYMYYTRGEDRSQMFQEVLAVSTPEEEPHIILQRGLDQAAFEQKVQEIRDLKIREGETFQTVLSHKNIYGITGSMSALYRRLRETCPSQNMHAIKMGDSESMGSFPELTLSIRHGDAAAYLVAGTAGRTGSVTRDAEIFATLLSDHKECAEHMMLVDLERNDMARHSIPGSVYLPEGLLMHRLDAGRVMHIASEVRSRIAKNVSPLDVLLDVTPMGTVSGAPKIRSMQIIHDYEQGETRGLYAGSFGFFDVRGDVEMVVGLRSLMRQKHQLMIQAGAGIVYDSIPKKEYAETVMKMQTGIRTVEPFLVRSL